MTEFCKLVREAIADEEKGAQDYQRIIDLADHADIQHKRALKDIQGDEVAHKYILKTIYHDVCERR
jgi:hypothetical protein